MIFNAINRLGVIVRSFNDLPLARAWAREHVHIHDGLRIQSVQVLTRTVYTPPRPRPSSVTPTTFTLPPVPA